MTLSLSDRRRRQLASDERAGRYARRRYREAYRSYVQTHWKLLSSSAVLGLGVTLGLAVVVHGPLARGLVIGACVTATAAALAHFVVLASGAGPLMMGEVAEQWTASELRGLQRGGWRIVNHYGLGIGDIDHVAVGSPGVFVIESKWSASSWTNSWAESTIERACGQATNAASQLAAWRDYKQLRLPEPRALVALWGSGAADTSGARDRCEVLAGSDLASRLKAFGLINPQLTAAQVDATWQVLSNHVHRRDEREALDHPIPPSLRELGVRVLAGVVAGLVSFFAAAFLLKADLPLWCWFVIVLALAVVEQRLRRWSRLRPLITGSQAGLVATGLLVAAVAGGQILR